MVGGAGEGRPSRAAPLPSPLPAASLPSLKIEIEISSRATLRLAPCSGAFLSTTSFRTISATAFHGGAGVGAAPAARDALGMWRGDAAADTWSSSAMGCASGGAPVSELVAAAVAAAAAAAPAARRISFSSSETESEWAWRRRWHSEMKALK